MSSLKYASYCVLAFSVLLSGWTFAKTKAPSLEDKNLKQVEKTFQWFNEQMLENVDQRIHLSKEMIAAYFTEDAKMVTNGKVACEGIEQHYQHFIAFQDQYAFMQAGPFKYMEAKGDKVWLYYSIDKKLKTGKQAKIMVMGMMQLKHGKIKLFEEVIAYV